MLTPYDVTEPQWVKHMSHSGRRDGWGPAIWNRYETIYFVWILYLGYRTASFANNHLGLTSDVETNTQPVRSSYVLESPSQEYLLSLELNFSGLFLSSILDITRPFCILTVIEYNLYLQYANQWPQKHNKKLYTQTKYIGLTTLLAKSNGRFFFRIIFPTSITLRSTIFCSHKLDIRYFSFYI